MKKGTKKIAIYMRAGRAAQLSGSTIEADPRNWRQHWEDFLNEQNKNIGSIRLKEK